MLSRNKKKHTNRQNTFEKKQFTAELIFLVCVSAEHTIIWLLFLLLLRHDYECLMKISIFCV